MIDIWLKCLLFELEPLRDQSLKKTTDYLIFDKDAEVIKIPTIII